MDLDRLHHSLAVANKMIEIGKSLEMSNDALQDLFILGFVHDIGYDFSDDIIKHNEVGGEILRKNQYKYWREVYNHGKPNSEYNSLYLLILNMTDMQVDKFGEDVGYIERLKDIELRYGRDSFQYINSSLVVERCKTEFDEFLKN